MTYYNSAALYGGRNPYGAGFSGGYNVYDEDYTGGWDIGQFYNMNQSEAITQSGANVVATAGLTPRQQLLIEWWQTKDGGEIPANTIYFAFGLVKLIDSLRARALTSDSADRQVLAERIKLLRRRAFGEVPGKSANAAQNLLYKVFLKAQKMIHRKPGINKVRARKWIINPSAAYTKGSWYKALPTPKIISEARRAEWPATRAKARTKLDQWKAFYERNRPPGTRKTRRSSTWSPRSSRLGSLSAFPDELAPPPPQEEEEEEGEPEAQRQKLA